MSEKVKSEELLKQAIKTSKQYLIEDGYLPPHILALSGGRMFYVPVVISEVIRPHDWILIIAETLKPDVLVFTGICRFSKKLPKNYKYGDLQKSKSKQALFIFLIDLKAKRTKGVLIPFETRRKKVIFKDAEEATSDQLQGIMPEIAEELFRKT